MVEFEKAKGKIMMGAERRSMVMTQKSRPRYLPRSGPRDYRSLVRNTIGAQSDGIPRGRALGVTFFLLQGDAISASDKKLESQISTLYGGRLAEEIIYGGVEHVSTGASEH